MRIAQTSDIHLEFGKYDIRNTEKADVLVLGGDICVARHLVQSDKEFFKQCSEEFKDVIYIMGNHEHYKGDFATTEGVMHGFLKEYENIHFLERESIEIGDVTFIGGTMWTDMNKGDDQTLFHIKERMNDFRIIANSNIMVSKKVPVYSKEPDPSGYQAREGWKTIQVPSQFSPRNAVEEYDKFIGYLTHVVENAPEKKYFVCTHHSPSRLSTREKYKHDYLMNGGYSSFLEEFILDHPQITAWTHGHTHDAFDYMIGGTHIVCNPRGYIGYEPEARNYKPKILEI